MPRDHSNALFHWRNYAGTLDASHSRATILTMLWACEQWMATSEQLDGETGQRVNAIKAKLQDWLAQHPEW